MLKSENFEGRLLLLLAILFPLGIYWFRSISDETIGGAGLGLFFLIMASLPAVCLTTILFWGFVVRVVSYGSTKTFTPFIVFASGVLISLILPLPPGPAEKAFYAHRSDYEAVVELARQFDLVHRGCGNAFFVPDKYQEWTDECVSVVYEPEFAVEFFIPNSYHTLTYAETPDALIATLFCDHKSSVFKQLEEHWYICSD